ncbi:MAG: GTPase ObgE [Anaerolineales bacterium]|nr:GTPase ObgE [Anaerolineales bacterium]MDW8446799.1 GTPase ObgE [Anaerolineales bacterium]
MFVDEAIIHVKAGKGGDGIVHFRREKFVPFGGPDGGDGGKGGDVILEVNPSLNTLYHLHRKRNYKAQDGAPGGKQNMTGKSGEDLIIQVPPGTLVYNAESGELLGDLTEKGQRLVVARGGRGGRGNARFATPVHQSPRVAEKGEPAEEVRLRLELRLIADVGIIGIPNAGKSTLLAKVTNAKPKIAPYPFTTLEPNLGVAVLDDELTITIADVPGLIEGAHRGVGLGIEFLKHVQRTKVLIHLLDGTSEDPVADFHQINAEMALFDLNLRKKPQVVALNKIDLPEVRRKAEEICRVLYDQSEIEKVWLISALTGENVQELLYQVVKLLQSLPREETLCEELPVYRVPKDPREFEIIETPEGWRVKGEAIERAAAMTYWEYPQSVRRFQKILQALGVEEALRKAGVQEGDTVFIGEYELEWVE